MKNPKYNIGEEVSYKFVTVDRISTSEKIMTGKIQIVRAKQNDYYYTIKGVEFSEEQLKPLNYIHIDRGPNFRFTEEFSKALTDHFNKDFKEFLEKL